MSDIEAYLDVQPKQWAVQKQERFEHRGLRDLLRLLEEKPGIARRVMERAGEDFGCTWFATNFPTFPVKLSTYKTPKPIATSVLLRNPHKLPIFRELCELADNYPTDEWGLLFASDGDGLPEMVIHTRIDWDVPVGHWRITLPESKMYIPGSTGTIERKWIIDPLIGFAQCVRTYTKWRLTEADIE